MKGFFKWFKNSAKMKRWMTIILIGIVLACIGISKIMVSKTVSFTEIGTVIALFVVGFTMIIIGLVYSQKRVLEILVEDTDYRMDNGSKERNVKSLIFNKKIYNEGPNIVVIGGGSGLNTVLKGLKKYTSNLTAIVTVSAYGKEQTESRKKLELLPIEDIKDSIISLSNDEEMMANLLDTELNNKNLKGLTFGDIFFTSMKEQFGNFSESVEKSKNVLNIVGRVLPVTLDEMQICAELSDGTIIEEREKIKDVVNEKISKIERVFISPSNCVPAPGVLEAIQNADAIIIGPGSLYTNVIPNLLVKNVSKAIKESNAIKIYISNIMTEPGQTDNYTLSDHLKAINEHVGTDIIDYCLADTGEVVPEYIRKYNKDGSDLVEIDSRKINEYNVKVIQRNMSCIKNERIRHKPDVIASTIVEMVCNDLKFHDMQNNTEYLLLQTVLKDHKKMILKEEKRRKKKLASGKPIKKEPDIKKNSKFKEKYRDRVESIQNTDAKIKENRRIAEEIEKMEKAKMAANKKREGARIQQDMPRTPKRRK